MMVRLNKTNNRLGVFQDWSEVWVNLRWCGSLGGMNTYFSSAADHSHLSISEEICKGEYARERSACPGWSSPESVSPW